MRNQCWALGLLVMSACSSGSPTHPTNPATPPATPQFSIRFDLRSPTTLSLSEPAPCPGDWSTCPRGPQPQGPRTTGPTTIRHYTLPPGTYRLTGVLQPSTSIGASVDIQIGTVATGGIGGGIAREGPVLGFVTHSGDLPSFPSVVSKVCGATFSNPSGELEWSVIFRVIATSQSFEQLCP